MRCAEGLIRHQPSVTSIRAGIPSLVKRWGRAAWLVPIAAALLIGAFLLRNPTRAGDITASDASQPRILQVSNPVAPMSDEDQQVLSAVAQHAPMMTAAYETNLHHVNDYIRDAQATVDANPNDEEGTALADGRLRAEIHVVQHCNGPFSAIIGAARIWRGGAPGGWRQVMQSSQQAAKLLMLLVALAVVAAAETREEFRFTVGPRATIAIVNQYGGISVKPSTGNCVVVCATRASDIRNRSQPRERRR